MMEYNILVRNPDVCLIKVCDFVDYETPSTEDILQRMQVLELEDLEEGVNVQARSEE